MNGVRDFIDETGSYWIKFEDTKTGKQNVSSIEYIPLFGCFDIFECYDCNAVYYF